MPGSPYGLAILAPPTTSSGPAAGALVLGILGVLVSLVALCVGLAGAESGWGLLAVGAFAVLAGWLGVGGILLGWIGIRQTRWPREPGRARPGGRGNAVAGLVCGSVALFLTMCGVMGTALVQYA